MPTMPFDHELVVLELLLGHRRGLGAEREEEDVGEHDAEEGGGERGADELAQLRPGRRPGSRACG